MRLAIVGKGGSGKSFICGTLIRILASRGHQILALDMDTMPGLAFSLGLPLETANEAELPNGLAERIPEQGWQLKAGVDLGELVQNHAIQAWDGVGFLQLGKLPQRQKSLPTIAFRRIFETYRKDGLSLVADLAFAQIILLVVNPTAKDLLSARRLTKLAQREAETKKTINNQSPLIGLVANKLRDDQDLALILNALTEHNLPLLAEIPYDEQLMPAEQVGKAPIDMVSETPAIQAIQKLAERLEKQIEILSKPIGKGSK